MCFLEGEYTEYKNAYFGYYTESDALPCLGGYFHSYTEGFFFNIFEDEGQCLFFQNYEVYKVQLNIKAQSNSVPNHKLGVY